LTSRAAPRGSKAKPSPPRVRLLNGDDLLRAFASASAWLGRNAQAIDAINVYPVPDGDTGSNMAGTLRDALAAADASACASAADVAGRIAHAALVSARGNSGVILSQWFGGFAEATAGAAEIDGRLLAAALARAAARARGALREPAEGTILTVAREAAAAAQGAAAAEPAAVLEAAVAGARAALERTPQLLPVLREAGVVDAGGLGLVVLLEGAVAGLSGSPLPAPLHTPATPDKAWLEAARAGGEADHSGFGYCTQFMLRPAPLPLEALRTALERLGDSLVLASDADRVRVHVHTGDPGAVLSLGIAHGSLTQISIENMQAQFERFAAHATLPPAVTPEQPASEAGQQGQQTAVVAVLAGSGLADVARSLGASGIVAGGATANPSVDEILAAIRAAPAENVIVLPNHKNVVLAAEQAAALSDRRAVVLPTRSAAQGIAVLAMFQADRSLDQNAEAMRTAQHAVRSIEVTRAARATRLNGVELARGQPIALVDGRLTTAAESSAGALLAAIEQLAPEAGAALTLYYGASVTRQDADAAAEQISARLQALDVQVVAGGQPHYDFIAALE